MCQRAESYAGQSCTVFDSTHSALGVLTYLVRRGWHCRPLGVGGVPPRAGPHVTGTTIHHSIASFTACRVSESRLVPVASTDVSSARSFRQSRRANLLGGRPRPEHCMSHPSRRGHRLCRIPQSLSPPSAPAPPCLLPGVGWDCVSHLAPQRGSVLCLPCAASAAERVFVQAT